MWQKLTNTEINQAVIKIREKYNTLINDFKKTRSLLDAFEERYINTLRTSKNISVFLLAEIEAVDEIYKKEKEKQNEIKQKRLNKEEKSFADKVYDENIRKMQKYPRANIGIKVEEEIERLIGAVRHFIIQYWPAVSHIYKNDKTTKLKHIFDNLYDKLITKINYRGESPITRSYILALQNFSDDIKKIESEYYQIVKETAFLLNEILLYIKKAINENNIPDADIKLYIYDSKEREWYNNFKNLTHKECIGKVYDYLQQIILDFRIKDIKKSSNTDLS